MSKPIPFDLRMALDGASLVFHGGRPFNGKLSYHVGDEYPLKSLDDGWEWDEEGRIEGLESGEAETYRLYMAPEKDLRILAVPRSKLFGVKSYPSWEDYSNNKPNYVHKTICMDYTIGEVEDGDDDTRR